MNSIGGAPSTSGLGMLCEDAFDRTQNIVARVLAGNATILLGTMGFVQ